MRETTCLTDTGLKERQHGVEILLAGWRYKALENESDYFSLSDVPLSVSAIISLLHRAGESSVGVVLK